MAKNPTRSNASGARPTQRQTKPKAPEPENTYVCKAHLNGTVYEIDVAKLRGVEALWIEEQAGRRWAEVQVNTGLLVIDTKVRFAVVSIAVARTTGVEPAEVWQECLDAMIDDVKVVIPDLPGFDDDEDGDDDAAGEGEGAVPPQSPGSEPSSEPDSSSGAQNS